MPFGSKKHPGIYPDCDVNPYNDPCIEEECPLPENIQVGDDTCPCGSLGVFRSRLITVEWDAEQDIPLPELWLFVHGHEPVSFGVIKPGETYEVTWDHRWDFDGRQLWALKTQDEDGNYKWIYSNDCCFDEKLGDSGLLGVGSGKDLVTGNQEYNFSGSIVTPLESPPTFKFFDNDFELNQWIESEDVVAEVRWGNNTTMGDFEMRLNKTPGTEEKQYSHINGGENVFHYVYDPINKIATFSAGRPGEEQFMTYEIPEGENPRLIVIRMSANRTGARFSLKDVTYNGVLYDLEDPNNPFFINIDNMDDPERDVTPDGKPLNLDTGYDTPGGPSTQFSVGIIADDISQEPVTITGTYIMEWDTTQPNPSGSRMSFTIKTATPDPERPLPERPTTRTRTFDATIKVDDCPIDVCTYCYDDLVFCEEWHDESAFSYHANTNPGLPLQVLTDSAGDIQPLRQLAITRSADALNQDLGLQYGSQKWLIVWDLELNRIIDFFPKAWLRYGAGMYFQQQTLRKGIDPNRNNRTPYYVEEFDLGLAFNGQGSYRLDHSTSGQRTDGWCIPSKLIGLKRDRQQLAPQRTFDNDAMSESHLYAEFNAVSVDAYRDIANNAVVAQRERFFQDRREFLHHTQVQRFHDQIMFLAKETISRIIRLITDSNEWLKNLVEMFNPETPDSFGNFAIVILNQIGNKILRTMNDRMEGIFKDTGLRNEEESTGDWLRYMYGEIRRLVELEKIDKKDVQATILETLTELTDLEGEDFLEALRNSLNIGAIKEQYDLAADGRVPPGAGVSDPDTDEENRIRGLAR